MTIDRGNSVGFILPFLMMFTVGIFYGNNLFAVIGILGAFSFRPQFALLGLILVVCRLYKHAFVTIFSGATIFFGSFLFIPLSYSDSLNSWLENLKMFSRKYDHGGPFPVNLSAKTSFGGIFEGSNYFLISGVLLFLVLLVFSVFHTTDQKGRMLIAILTLPCLVPSLSFGYYSIFVLVIAAMIFTEPEFLEPTTTTGNSSNSRRQIKTRVAYNYLLITVVAISLAPIPFVREVGRNSIALESFSTLWTIVLIATLAQQIVEYYNAKVAT
jgi:hypothetical protein